MNPARSGLPLCDQVRHWPALLLRSGLASARKIETRQSTALPRKGYLMRVWGFFPYISIPRLVICQVPKTARHHLNIQWLLGRGRVIHRWIKMEYQEKKIKEKGWCKGKKSTGSIKETGIWKKQLLIQLLKKPSEPDYPTATDSLLPKTLAALNQEKRWHETKEENPIFPGWGFFPLEILKRLKWLDLKWYSQTKKDSTRFKD